MSKVLSLLPSLLFLLLLTHPGLVRSEAREPDILFSKAYELFSRGDLSRAKELFLRTLDNESALRDYSLYFLGVICLSQGTLDSARDYLYRLRREFPRSVWFDHANLQLAKISIAEKDYAGAIDRLRALGPARVKEPVSSEALYLLGEIYRQRGEPAQAISSYQRLRRTFPLSPWAVRAKREVHRLRRRYPKLLGLTDPEAMLEEGELLIRERDYDTAARSYRRFSGLVTERKHRLRLLKGLARAYRRARQGKSELAVLTEILEQFPDSPEVPGVLSRKARIFWNQGEDLRALAEFKRLEERFPESPLLDFAAFASARIYESLEKPDEALRIYRDFSKRFPSSRLREDSAWRLAWIHYLRDDYAQAHGVFKGIASDNGATRYGTASLFWQARSAERSGRPEEAKRIYREILEGETFEYYAGPAARRLERMGAALEKKKQPSQAFPGDRLPPFNSVVSFHFSRAQHLARISLHHLAVVELDAIKNHIGRSATLRVFLMRAYERSRAYDRSVALASQLNRSSNGLARHLYPLAYWDVIKKNAEERGLDPYLILALIRQESLFDPRALSPASAFGLMQLLPSTARQEATRMGLALPASEKLFDPDFNLTLGIQHLKGLLERYSNSFIKALAAYNAGKRAVDRWERELAARDEEEFVERIPYRETRRYVKLVLRNYLAYRELYGAER